MRLDSFGSVELFATDVALQGGEVTRLSGCESKRHWNEPNIAPGALTGLRCRRGARSQMQRKPLNFQ